MSQSTIVALSSGALPSGVAVIRLSGPAALASVSTLCGALPPPRSLALRTVRDASGRALDTGLVAIFPAPHSFTGEDCAELQVHGSVAGVKTILAALTAIPGIALAAPGDFTRRAFENGKLDLTEVEGLGDLLAAETESQRRQALARLSGNLSQAITRWRDRLLDLRAEIEAHLDFSDEDDVPEQLPHTFGPDLQVLIDDIGSTLSKFETGRIQREGLRIVLVGAPNAGKSSLLNALAGSDLAIVTDEAGTTRDVKEVAIDLGGQLVLLADTAGLRETDSKAEAEGIRRAHAAMAQADLILHLVAPDIPAAHIPATAGAPVMTVATKSDLGVPPGQALAISTQTGAGLNHLIDCLKHHIEERLGAGEPQLVSHLRDKTALEQAIAHLQSALTHIGTAELCAEDLRRTSDSLARLIGLMDTELVLDRLFAGFCIGK
jgi:tRNA modification GTPase